MRRVQTTQPIERSPASSADPGAPGKDSGAELVARLVGATVIFDDRPALRAVDLDLGAGLTMLRGPNGAGKTTALRALAGLLPLARGTRQGPPDVLYLGHRPQLLHGLTPRENLRFFLDFRSTTAPTGTSAAARRSQVASALERWGLRDAADRPVERLSAGQRRRAALARLDLEACDLVLLDEPFAELDDDAARLLRTSLGEIVPRSAALIASHGHAELDASASRVYELRDGAISRATA